MGRPAPNLARATRAARLAGLILALLAGTGAGRAARAQSAAWPVTHRTLAGALGRDTLELDLRIADTTAGGAYRVIGAAARQGYAWGSLGSTGDVTLELRAEPPISGPEDDSWRDGTLSGALATATAAGWRLAGSYAAPDGGASLDVVLTERRVELPGGATIRPVDVRAGGEDQGWTFYAEKPVIEAPAGTEERPAYAAFDRVVDSLFAADREQLFADDFEPDSEAWVPGPWTYEAWYRVARADARLLSVELRISTYTGGAHGYTATRTIAWDLDAGRELALEDLFRPGSPWIEIVSEYARARLHEGLGGESFEDDWIERGAGADRGNYTAWTPEVDGLRVLFDPYQVAPYADGRVEVTIPWSTLASILDPDGPLGYLVPPTTDRSS